MAIVLVFAFVPPASSPQSLPATEAATLQCAHQVFAAVGEKVWPGWSRAPFSTLLIVGDHEFLVSKMSGVAGFSPTDAKPLPGYVILHRSRSFDSQLLATFPAFSSEPTIVVGTPSATGKSQAAWLITLLHEHFHQLQYSQSWYYTQTAALNLAKGDTTGMWMLNYDFPYADSAVQRRYEKFSRALGDAVRARGTARFTTALREVKSKWRELRENLHPDDYAYFRFQAWQEGVARYAELIAARNAAGHEPAIPCLGRIKPPLSQVAKETLSDIYASLDAPKLGERKRVAFYAVGAAIALLFDETSPSWKVRYFEQPFDLEAYFAP